MNVPNIPPQSNDLQESENSADDRALAIAAALPRDADEHTEQHEVSTRQHTVDAEADGAVMVNELNESKRRKMEVESISVGGNIQATLDAMQANLMKAIQANHADVMARIDATNARLDHVSIEVAKIPNNHTRGHYNNYQSPTYPWRPLVVENVYVQPANNPNPNPPAVLSMPPNQPQDLNAVLAMDDAAIDALGLAFNKTFDGDDLDARRDAVIYFYRVPHS